MNDKRLSPTELEGQLNKLGALRGGPIVSEIRSHIKAIEGELSAAQAKIDALMLEYCPGEMTQEQLANWKRHQTPGRP